MSAMNASADGRTGRGRGGVLVFEPERVAGSAGRPVQRDARREEHVVALVQRRVVLGRERQSAALGPPQRLGVADAAVAVLQVGLEDVGDVAGVGLPGADATLQLRQPLLAAPAEARPTGLDDLVAELRVTGDVASRQQGGRGVEIGLRQRQGVVDAAHRVPELEAGVPDRVPDRTRDRLEAARRRLMHQQQVDVAERRQLAAPVPADGDQCEARSARVLLSGERRERDDPGVGRLCELVAVRAPAERSVGQGGQALLVGRGDGALGRQRAHGHQPTTR
jgi:hypothetical protein